jgi:hypothetical protein
MEKYQIDKIVGFFAVILQYQMQVIHQDHIVVDVEKNLPLGVERRPLFSL